MCIGFPAHPSPGMWRFPLDRVVHAQAHPAGVAQSTKRPQRPGWRMPRPCWTLSAHSLGHRILSLNPPTSASGASEVALAWRPRSADEDTPTAPRPVVPGVPRIEPLEPTLTGADHFSHQGRKNCLARSSGPRGRCRTSGRHPFPAKRRTRTPSQRSHLGPIQLRSTVDRGEVRTRSDHDAADV